MKQCLVRSTGTWCTNIFLDVPDELAIPGMEIKLKVSRVGHSDETEVWVVWEVYEIVQRKT